MAQQPAGRERIVVATVLAIGLVLVVVMIDFAFVWQVMMHGTGNLPEPLGQVMLASVAGMVGLLGGYLGVKVGRRGSDDDTTTAAPTPPSEPPTDNTTTTP